LTAIGSRKAAMIVNGRSTAGDLVLSNPAGLINLAGIVDPGIGPAAGRV
jgi:hypothetical protein